MGIFTAGSFDTKNVSVHSCQGHCIVNIAVQTYTCSKVKRSWLLAQVTSDTLILKGKCKEANNWF